MSHAQERQCGIIVPQPRQCLTTKLRPSARGISDVIDSILKDSTRMKVIIHHNPRCGTSRKTLKILQDSGHKIVVNKYLTPPPSRAELARLYQRAGITPRDGLRTKEP